MSQQFDVVVIGSGPAGGVVAKICREAGLNVAVAEKNGFGGVCPLRGCEPKKTLIEAAWAVRRIEHMQGHGVNGKAWVAWSELMRFKRGFTEPIPEKVLHSYKERGITPLHGACMFSSAEKLALVRQTGMEPEPLEARRVCIAAGARPRQLDFPGAELMATSDDFLELDELPQRILFIGGGFVSMEFATAAAAAGSQVTVVTHGDRFLRGFDADLVDRLLLAMEDQGITLHRNLPGHRMEQGAAGLVFYAGEQGGTRLEADYVVNGAGRVPNTSEMQLEQGNVTHERGAVSVDASMRSVSNEMVYAAGDCADQGLPLTPVAVHQAEVAAANICADLDAGGQRSQTDYSGTSSAVFTDPPLAAVGLLEQEAREQGLEFDVFAGDAAKWSEYKRIGRQHAGYKILVGKHDGRVLGGHFLGEGAEELASLVGLAIRQGLDVTALRQGIWAYPSHAYTLRYMLL